MKYLCKGGPFDGKEVEFEGRVRSFTASTEFDTYTYKYSFVSNAFVLEVK